MNTNNKTIYVVAIIAIIILCTIGYQSTRIYNGIKLSNDILISFNSEELHGANIDKKVKLVSFETGFALKLNITNLSYEDGGVVSLAFPIENLKPESNYSATLKFNMHTNNNNDFKVKTNKNISNEVVAFNTDIDYKPITLSPISNQYVIQIKFNTNELGIGYVIFDFPIDAQTDDLNVSFDNVIISNFKELNDDSISEEQQSDISLEAL